MTSALTCDKPLRNKKESINRVRVHLERDTALLERLQREEAALRLSKTVRVSIITHWLGTAECCHSTCRAGARLADEGGRGGAARGDQILFPQGGRRARVSE